MPAGRPTRRPEPVRAAAARGCSPGRPDETDRPTSHRHVERWYVCHPTPTPGGRAARTAGAQTIIYQSDQLGNRLRVVVSGTTAVDYLVDGLNRRVALKATVGDRAAEPAVGEAAGDAALVDERRQRRPARYAAVVALHQAGRSIIAISHKFHLARATVRSYLRAGPFPKRAPRRTILSAATRHGA